MWARCQSRLRRQRMTSGVLRFARSVSVLVSRSDFLERRPLARAAPREADHLLELPRFVQRIVLATTRTSLDFNDPNRGPWCLISSRYRPSFRPASKVSCNYMRRPERPPSRRDGRAELQVNCSWRSLGARRSTRSGSEGAWESPQGVTPTRLCEARPVADAPGKPWPGFSCARSA